MICFVQILLCSLAVPSPLQTAFFDHLGMVSIVSVSLFGKVEFPSFLRMVPWFPINLPHLFWLASF